MAQDGSAVPALVNAFTEAMKKRRGEDTTGTDGDEADFVQ